MIYALGGALIDILTKAIMRDTDSTMKDIDSFIPFPRIQEMITWSNSPSFATALKSVMTVDVSPATLEKCLKSWIYTNAPRVSKKSENKVYKQLRQMVLDSKYIQSLEGVEPLYADLSKEGIFHVSAILRMSEDCNHRDSYLACVVCDLFTEDLCVLNNFDVETTDHVDSLIKADELPEGLSDDAFGLVRRIDCAFYIFAAQHAELIHEIPPCYESDLFLGLFKTPYETGVLQERYFKNIRDLTKKKTYSALRLHADDGVNISEAGNIKCSKRQINAWRNKNGEANASPESIANLFEYSLDMQRREDDVQIYTKGYQMMTSMRRILDQLEEETNIECVNQMLDRYRRYFFYHQETISSWIPRNPFLE